MRFLQNEAMNAPLYPPPIALVSKPLASRRLSATARLVSTSRELRAAYDALLGGLRLSPALAAGNSVMVTSTVPKEGKTTIASCLAIAASLAGHSVLLVDGDLRGFWLTSATGLTAAAGLGEFLHGKIEGAEAIHRVDLLSEVREAGPIHIMGAGRKTPASLMAVDWADARMRFQAVARPFGIVIMDASPIFSVVDPMMLAGIADGVLLAVDAEKVRQSDVRRTKERLQEIRTPLIGAAMNQVDPRFFGPIN